MLRPSLSTEARAMALPAVLLSPVALRALQVGGALALAAWVASRKRAESGPERVDMASEDALDRIPEGADLRADPANGRADAEARWRRVVRFGGRGVEIEAAALGRLRWRRV